MFAISRVSINIPVSPLNSSTLRGSESRDGEHVVSLNIHEDFGQFGPIGSVPSDPDLTQGYRGGATTRGRNRRGTEFLRWYLIA